MNRAEVLEIVAKARAEGKRADLRGANLYGADLRGADLGVACLRGAYLRGADLRGADLYGADLYGAYLYGFPLLQVLGLPSGDAYLAPWEDGWELRVGCWTGDPDSLEQLIASDEGWPEAEGGECARRRPGLVALIAQCRAWIEMHPDAIEQAVARKAEWERIQAEVKSEAVS